MSILSEKIKRARQTRIAVGAHFLTIRRPTDLDMLELRNEKIKQRDVIERFVVDWDDVKESDLFSGGNPDLVPFDFDAYKEWIADHPEYWAAITDAVVASYKEHEAKVGEIVKN